MAKIYTVTAGQDSEAMNPVVLPSIETVRKVLPGLYTEQEGASEEVHSLLESLTDKELLSEYQEVESGAWFTVIEHDLDWVNFNAPDAYEEKAPLNIEVTQGVSGVWIGAQGYRDFHNNRTVVLVENVDGNLSVKVWADKGREDPTHAIEMERAKDEGG